jgi:hypothetical protein
VVLQNREHGGVRGVWRRYRRVGLLLGGAFRLERRIQREFMVGCREVRRQCPEVGEGDRRFRPPE